MFTVLSSFLSSLGSKAWKVVAAIMAGAAAVLAGLWWIADARRQKSEAKARRKAAEASELRKARKQRKAADEASRAAKEAGDDAVEETRKQARSGDRSHFERGMHDD